MLGHGTVLFLLVVWQCACYSDQPTAVGVWLMAALL